MAGRKMSTGARTRNRKAPARRRRLEGRFKAYPLREYPDVGAVDFPQEIYIAFAVCGKRCGVNEFIVDGSTQVCNYCGRLKFRTEVRRYVLAVDQRPSRPERE